MRIFAVKSAAPFVAFLSGDSPKVAGLYVVTDSISCGHIRAL
jgi:hypothetical protein